MGFPGAPVPVLLQYAFVGTLAGESITGSVMLDASIGEQHIGASQVTEHQVENGPDVADHIRPMPNKVSIDGIITNTPINTPTTQMFGVTGRQEKIDAGSTSYRALKFSDTFDRVKDAHNTITEALEGSALWTVTTTLARYENMVVVNYSVTRNAENGNSLRFVADFQQIRIVESQEVAALPSQKKGTKHNGHQSPSESSDTEKQGQTTAFSLIHGGG